MQNQTIVFFTSGFTATKNVFPDAACLNVTKNVLSCHVYKRCQYRWFSHEKKCFFFLFCEMQTAASQSVMQMYDRHCPTSLDLIGSRLSLLDLL